MRYTLTLEIKSLGESTEIDKISVVEGEGIGDEETTGDADGNEDADSNGDGDGKSEMDGEGLVSIWLASTCCSGRSVVAILIKETIDKIVTDEIKGTLRRF